MKKNRSEAARAIGKLISSIQKEWGDELGCGNAEITENVMGAAHKLLQAETSGKLLEELAQLNVRQYLGDLWIQSHPSVKPAITAIENAINKIKSLQNIRDQG
ncbi:hypothetical protein FHR59_002979 [Xanthomonas arboricola]|uniref:hypothetical protein n=1 Tax=Xanthomonas arboricola TaxID=56448 RepID=UPI00161816EB|nr:hypothetical protein [Xanthomonas arboricola]MBB6338716.1 hypothetical protein [Xanthomonas arboricola]